MNLTPREDFRKSLHAKGWSDLCASPQFEEAAKAALLELQFRLTMCNATGIKTAAMNSFRLQGAQEFLTTMMSLTDTETTTKPTTTGLNYRS